MIKKKIFKFLINFIPFRKYRRQVRNKYFYGKKYNIPDCFTDDSSCIESPEGLQVGKHVWIGGEVKMFCSKFCPIKIGNNCFIAMNTVMYTTFHNYANTNMLPFDYSDICSPIDIGDNVWIGSHCIILPGVKIEEGAVIAAGSVVSKSVPKCAIVAGNPAQIVKMRDMEMYEKLKVEDKHPDWISPDSPQKKYILKNTPKPFLEFKENRK